MILSLGAGMTVRFFPIFFADEVKVSPVTFQGVIASMFLFNVLGSMLPNTLSKRFGRLQVLIPAFFVGSIFTLMLGSMKIWYGLAWIMLAIYTIRCTILWSFYGQMMAVIADYTPKATRGRWKAVTSIAQESWSGSAAVGGWLIDSYGFGVSFMITACVQSLCLPLWSMLIPIVVKESEITAARTITDLNVSLQPQTAHADPRKD